MLDKFGFLCPHRISHILIQLKNDQSKERPMKLNKERANERARYISNAMGNASMDQKFFAPYSAGGHWMLFVLDPYAQTVYWLDSVGATGAKVLRDDIKHVVEMSLKIWIAGKKQNKPNKVIKWIELKCPTQTNGIDCGYYVLRFMWEIISKAQTSVPEKPPSVESIEHYTPTMIDLIRDQWATFVQSFMFDGITN